VWQLGLADVAIGSGNAKTRGNTYGVDVSSHGKIQASPPARITARVSLGVTSGYAQAAQITLPPPSAAYTDSEGPTPHEA